VTEHDNFHSVNILVVEDEVFSLKFISRILSKLGIAKVHEAHDGAEAISLLEDSDISIDLVISDIEMPNMDGYELVRRIRYGVVPKYQNIPILMLTGQDTNENVSKARIHKIQGYIVKPPKVDQIEFYLKQALGMS